MKKILFSIMCLAMSILMMKAQDNIYVINGYRVPGFDGSQVSGKTISQYRIMNFIEKLAGKVKEVHWIDTADGEKPLGAVAEKITDITQIQNYVSTEAAFGGTEAGQPLVLVDGEVYSGKIQDIKADDIAEMRVYKAGSDFAAHYGESGKNGVVLVSTVRNSGGAMIYVVDGKKTSESTLHRINPLDIKKMDVYKPGSESALKMGPEGATHGYIIVYTK